MSRQDVSVFELLATIEHTSQEITRLESQRDLAIRAAIQSGARLTDLARASGITRQTLAQRYRRYRR